MLERCGSGLLVSVWASPFFFERCKSVLAVWLLLLLLLLLRLLRLRLLLLRLLLLLLRSGRWRVCPAPRRWVWRCLPLLFLPLLPYPLLDGLALVKALLPGLFWPWPWPVPDSVESSLVGCVVVDRARARLEDGWRGCWQRAWLAVLILAPHLLVGRR
jgi:hypothetical protein